MTKRLKTERQDDVVHTFCTMLLMRRVFINFRQFYDECLLLLGTRICNLEFIDDIVSSVYRLPSMESLIPKTFEVCLKVFYFVFNVCSLFAL